MTRVAYLFFWPDFCLEKEPLYQFVFGPKGVRVDYITELPADPDKMRVLMSGYDLIVGGCFIPTSLLWIYTEMHSKIIFCVTEPIEFWHPALSQMYMELPFKACYGCVPQHGSRSIKYPLYLWNDDLEYQIETSRARIIATTPENISRFRFCCLINRHDHGGTRTAVFHELSRIGPIVCPGRLFNNHPNADLETMGKHAFLQDFLFHICPENFSTRLAGYITEKLFQCVMAGPIPVYAGAPDEFDARVFNMDRVLLFQSDDPDSIRRTAARVEQLVRDPNALQAFYTQDPFTPKTIETVMELRLTLVREITLILEALDERQPYPR